MGLGSPTPRAPLRQATCGSVALWLGQGTDALTAPPHFPPMTDSTCPSAPMDSPSRSHPGSFHIRYGGFWSFPYIPTGVKANVVALARLARLKAGVGPASVPLPVLASWSAPFSTTLPDGSPSASSSLVSSAPSLSESPPFESDSLRDEKRKGSGHGLFWGDFSSSPHKHSVQTTYLLCNEKIKGFSPKRPYQCTIGSGGRAGRQFVSPYPVIPRSNGSLDSPYNAPFIISLHIYETRVYKKGGI